MTTFLHVDPVLGLALSAAALGSVIGAVIARRVWGDQANDAVAEPG